MIGYPCTRKELEAAIETESPGWLADTAGRTKGFIKRKKFDETKSAWSEVKVVYMRLQGGAKCAFCERKLESETYGAGEQAVEHFRPKGRVMPWKSAPADVPVAPVKKGQKGYYWLSYHPFNYSAACHPCNSSLKGDRFPIAGKYQSKGDPAALQKSELPLLIYPIGDIDADPESLITFTGALPVPVHSSGKKRQRAAATIKFFDLDNLDTRGNLFKERANVIVLLQAALDNLNGSAAARARAQLILDNAARPNFPHANCARSFLRLAKADPAAASRIADAAAQLAASSS